MAIIIMEYNFSDSFKKLQPSAIREIFKSLTDPTIISFAQEILHPNLSL